MRRRSRWILKRGKLVPHIVEEDVVEEITTRLWLQYRIKVWRVRERIPGVGVAPSTAGIPDLIGYFIKTDWSPNVTVPFYIEVKRPGGARRPAQIRFIEDARSDGCVAFFAECWGDVVREMNDQCGIKLKEVA